MKTSGADILRLWVASSDYSSDIRFGPAILQGTVESYRKLRNTLRWMLGTLAHYDRKQTVAREGHAGAGAADAAPADRARRARSARPTPTTTTSAWWRLLSQFMNTDLSAFYVDIRKDALYCEPYSQHQAQGGAGDHRADLPLHLRCGWRR